MPEGDSKTGSESSARKRSLTTTWVTTAFSAAAVLFSVYSLWESRLKQSDLRVFVPAVIEYSAPYQNSNFEAIMIPVTISNEGARTGTVLSLELDVTDPRTNQTKRFYAANFGRWTMERTRSGAYQPFAPIALAGYSSRTETVQFYTRGEDEKPPQVIRETQAYRFAMTLRDVGNDQRAPLTLSFERELRNYDARAFTNGTLWLYPKDWHAPKQAASNVSAP
jgi:hypothetical protein